jgi:hypothetical protein
MEIIKKPYFKATFEVLGADQAEVRREVQKFVGMSKEMRELVTDYKNIVGKE